MKNKTILLLLILLIFKVDNVSALTYNGCDYSTVARMKYLVTNVNISYDYKIIDNEAYFDVTLTNIFPDSYFIDLTTGKIYTYNDTTDGELTIRNYKNYSGNYKFYIGLSDCYGTFIGSKYYKFPYYNTYYNSDLCSDIPNFSLCQKWANVNYSSLEFEKLVKEYKESLNVPEEEEKIQITYEKGLLDIVADVYTKYYYYFLIVIIVICSIVMVMTRRKDRFKL